MQPLGQVFGRMECPQVSPTKQLDVSHWFLGGVPTPAL